MYLVTDCISKITHSILTHLDRESFCLDSILSGIIHQSVTQTVSAVIIHRFIKRRKLPPLKLRD